MDIGRASFPAKLPTILRDISQSHFVAFDLELSGIPTNRRRGESEGRQTLEDRYAEVKKAAEQFHILQVGLTCVEQDKENDRYLLRCYNFNISPLIHDELLEIERTFTYSSGAVDFLLSHGYQMDSPFKDGVPYLSKDDAQLAKERALLRWDKASIPDIKIKPNDFKAIAFMQRVRSEVTEWQKKRKPHANYYNVGGKAPRPDSPSTEKEPLSKFEKRLVHQIVRAEFPNLQTFSRTEYVQVQPRDEDELNSIRETLNRRLDAAVTAQIGFRWIAEAMAGGDLSGLEPGEVAQSIEGEPRFWNIDAYQKRFGQIRNDVRNRQSVLVGHNCFMDLVFFYKQFYGELPDTVAEFQHCIHKLFPTIIDTKYIATRDHGKWRSSQLWQIDEALEDQEQPLIQESGSDPKYFKGAHYHEAGFDSYVTSKVFLRLAANLEAIHAQKRNVPVNVEDSTQNDDSEVLPSGGVKLPSAITRSVSGADSGASTSTGLLQKIFGGAQKPKVRETTSDDQATKGRFSHNNVYDGLRDVSEDQPDEPADEDALAETPTSSSSTIKPTDASSTAEALSHLTVDGVSATEASTSTIPQWNSELWGIYANRLRVYGTQEEVLVLKDQPTSMKD